MFESHAVAYTDSKKKIRYEPIERRKVNRRAKNSDRRSEAREEQMSTDRRKNSDRRK